MKLEQAWITQAKSDWRTALLLAAEADDCQRVAKYQQAVEKSVKALAVALTRAGIVAYNVGSAHDVARIASSIQAAAPAWSRQYKDLKRQLAKAFARHHLESIKQLDAIVPQYPAKGQLARRNSEYPFQQVAGDTWCVPCGPSTFSKGDVKRYEATAKTVVDVADKLVTALGLAKP